MRQLAMRSLGWALSCALIIAGCDRGEEVAADGAVSGDAGCVHACDAGDGASDDGGGIDGAVPTDDASIGTDAAARDADVLDAGEVDAGASDDDSGVSDAGGLDAGASDAGPIDAGPPDAGPIDAGPIDSGPPDSGVVVGDCISGATGTHAVRFRWAGSGPGSTAYVMYERNQLPDTSRWRVSAASMSIGYRPVFDDVFLGEGGLDLGGTVFIDVELSTMGLSSLRNVTIAVYGRSFNTTASGSFTWQTFDGVGASPPSSLANSAPYEWYPADATTAFRAGNGGVLLRLRAGPSSNRIVVNRVEICFDAI